MKFIDGVPNPEFVGEDELKVERRLSKIALQASYQERLHQFKSDVMLLMMKHDALDPDACWLVYDHAEDANDGPVILAPRTDICIASRQFEFMDKSNKQLKQHIRVMVNEAFMCDDGIDYLVTDVVIDTDDDAQYFIGPMPNRTSVSVENVETSLFFVQDGKLGMASHNQVRMFPPIVSVQDEVGDCRDDEVYPFGLYSNIEDNIHALSVATDILKLVYNRTPQYTS